MKIFISQQANPLLKQVTDCLVQQEELLSDAEKAQHPFWTRALMQVVQTYGANKTTPKSFSFTQVTNGYSMTIDSETVGFLKDSKREEVSHA